MASNNGVTDEWYIVKGLAEFLCGLIGVLYRHLPGSTEENHDRLRKPVISIEVHIEHLASKRLSVTAVPNNFSSRLISKYED